MWVRGDVWVRGMGLRWLYRTLWGKYTCGNELPRPGLGFSENTVGASLVPEWPTLKRPRCLAGVLVVLCCPQP